MRRGKPRISRRTFVKGLGGAFAAPYIIPASALGKESRAKPSNRIVFGVIGVGHRGKAVMSGLLAERQAHVAALCDVNERTLSEAKGIVDRRYETKSTRTYGDLREMLARDDLDAVVIGTPDHWHAFACVLAAKAGKHIYCEKPLSHSFAEGRAVANAVKKNDVVLQVGSQLRSYRRVKFACELVRNGCLGKINHINAGLPNGGQHGWTDSFPEPPAWVDYDLWVGPAAMVPYHPKRHERVWRWWSGFGGGQLMDWVGHQGDVAHMAMGWDNTGADSIQPLLWEMPKEKNNLYDTPARYKFECTYAGGATMLVGNLSDMPEVYKACDGIGTQWFGDNGQWVYVSQGDLRASPESLLDTEFGEGDFRFRKQGNHLRDFLECIKSRETTAAPVETGHRSASIGHLGQIACVLNQKLTWDPAKERFEGNDDANAMLQKEHRGDWSLT